MKELFSFSRLTTFKQCPYSYYLTYVVKTPRKDNVYSFLGSKVHELLENMQDKQLENKRAVEEFDNAVKLTEIFGYKFPTENSKKNYVECIREYMRCYKRIEDVDYFIEEYFEVEIEGVRMRGYIDLYTIEDGKYIDVYDYKSSSKFGKQDLEIKKLQLIIYAMALAKKYPDMVIRNLHFDMCKYTKNARGTLIERNKYHKDGGKGLITVKYSEQNVLEAKDFIKGIYEEIKSLKEKKGGEWEAKANPFFCKNICSNYDYCEKGKNGYGNKR